MRALLRHVPDQHPAYRGRQPGLSASGHVQLRLAVNADLSGERSNDEHVFAVTDEHIDGEHSPHWDNPQSDEHTAQQFGFDSQSERLGAKHSDQHQQQSGAN